MILRVSAEHNSGTNELLDEITAQIPQRTAVPDDNVLRIALIGRPNVGKSTLFNRLAGKQQALVAKVAGTTRDVNRVKLRFENRDIELLDTAGIRRSGKQEVGIEKFSVLRSLQAIEQADVCLLLIDAGELHTSLDQKLAGIIKDAGKGLIIVVSKWDAYEKDAYSRDRIAPQISHAFAFVPWAPLIFTSAVTGQNITKLFELARDIDKRRSQQLQTAKLNRLLANCLAKHPPAGLKNRHPKLRYLVQSDTSPPWFILFGSHLTFLHWSYKRYLEKALRDEFDFAGTTIKISYRDERGRK
jgi:GTP-binding protein